MKTLRKMMQRVKDLESRLHVDPTVYVNRITFPKSAQKGCVYMKTSEGPGLQFKNDEEANDWISQDKKRFPLGSTAVTEKNQPSGMPWEQLPALKKRVGEVKERLRREKNLEALE